jgi:hypothetical protein
MQLGRDADPLPPSSVVVKNRVELYLYSPFVAFVAYERVKPTYVGPSNYLILNCIPGEVFPEVLQEPCIILRPVSVILREKRRL